MPSGLLLSGGDALPVVEDPTSILGFLRAESAHRETGMPVGWMRLTSPATPEDGRRVPVYVDTSRITAIQYMTITELDELENEL